MFAPRLEILPPGQQWLWPRLSVFSDEGMVLYGGTAIALRLGHRISEDFDFFSERVLDKAAVRKALHGLDYEVLQDVENTYTLLIAASTPDGWVKLSCFGGLGFGRFGEPEIAAGSAVVVASPDDLLATKLAAVMVRIQSKDYRDIAALLRAGVSLARGLAIAAGMYGAQFAAAQCLKTLTYFHGGDLAELAANDRNTLCAAAAAVGDLPGATRVSSILGIEKG
ncbi:MAG TPA: nucleotidyl transferase AbiEii/AbiGii toxin family protein [Steroidobacteraceae bacterium]|jgi:hypothetical protein|nr:nucleotidyl transferase AbiEii/AbiGii toxin family protein [Steroidobacteraceae bacterium]